LGQALNRIESHDFEKDARAALGRGGALVRLRKFRVKCRLPQPRQMKLSIQAEAQAIY
jgi:hypothetical protein